MKTEIKDKRFPKVLNLKTLHKALDIILVGFGCVLTVKQRTQTDAPVHR